MDSLAGRFLIASPHLPDPNFAQTVVLMVQHSEEGALGLILDRPSQSQLSEIWTQVDDQPPGIDQPIFLGGPVEGPLMAIHTSIAHAEETVIEGVYFSSGRDSLLAIVAQSANPYRIFSGYAGWGGGQLEVEMQVGGWLTLPATEEMIFESDPTELWKQVVRRVGSDILRDTLGIKGMPEDPSVN